MTQSKLTRLELQILEALWSHGKASIREIQEVFPAPRPAYTTIQTTIYRLEGKNVVRRVRKIGNADIFEPTVARDVTRHRLLDEILSFFGGARAADDGAACGGRKAHDRRCARVGKDNPGSG
ncbi:MAG: BlaI/MecI/CopY family transcriptional regulator [Paludibaculum sp.]